MTPTSPKRSDQSLPPMLSDTYNISIPSCSEASRGLSVLPQGGGIFTDIAISPDPSLRQFLSRDAIRAGLKLPDKEFRYHRTVIVTAGVHRRLVSVAFTGRFNVPTLARRHPLYILLRVRRELCFW